MNNIVELRHLMFGILLPLAGAIIIHEKKVYAPDENPMEIAEQYWRNARNLLINMAMFSFMGFALNMLFRTAISLFGAEVPSDNWFFSGIFVLLSAGTGLLILANICKSPPENSIMRTQNIVFSRKRTLPYGQGDVDNTVKYRSPIIAIPIWLADSFLGFIDTESQRNISESGIEIRCKDGTLSGKFNISYVVGDSDAFSAQGTDNTEIENKIRNHLTTKMSNIIEEHTAKLPVREVFRQANELSRDISDRFNNEARQIESQLGINVQLFNFGQIDLSKSQREALNKELVMEAVRKQARELVDESGDTLDWEKAVQIAAGTMMEGVDYRIIHASGLRGAILDTNDIVKGESEE